MYLKIKNDVAAGKIAPAYVFYGAERFLLDSALDYLIEAIAPEGSASFNLDKVDGNNTNLREIVGLCNMLPFFAEKKLILVENAHWFATAKKNSAAEENDDKPDEGSQIGIDDMIAYLANPAPTTCLVFLAGEKVNKTKRLTKAVAKNGVLAEFLPLSNNDAVRWLDTVLAERRLQMNQEAKKQFLFNCGYSCAFAVRELDKLECYKGDNRRIGTKDIELLTAKNTTANIFQMIDKVAEGNLEKSLGLLHQLLLTENEYTIIPLLAGHFRTVLMAKNLKSRGYNLKMIMDITGKRSSFVIEKALRQGSRYTERQLKLVLEILLQADKKSKTGVSASVKEVLETAVIQICYLTKK
ncbi:MAG: DNA polymerase III subunit delta [Bacillota bacterium]|jgi:DNA polymerase-3 subunit delta